MSRSVATPNSVKRGVSAAMGTSALLLVARTEAQGMSRSTASSTAVAARRVLPKPAPPTRSTPPQLGSSMAAVSARSSASRPTSGSTDRSPPLHAPIVACPDPGPDGRPADQ